MYYIQYQGTSVGPMTAAQLASYPVTPDTLVYAEGGEWRPLYTYPELMELVSRRNTSPTHASQAEDSQRIVCGILALLIGWIGLQYFLIGKTTGGLINIALSLVTCGLWGVINFVQGILILCMSDAEWRRKFVDSPSVFPIF
jgi:hypothetical protein